VPKGPEAARYVQSRLDGEFGHLWIDGG
jgi:hypothetical protein